MNSVKSVLIGKADNGYIAFVTVPWKASQDVRVYGTWLEMFTDLGSYFAEGLGQKTVYKGEATCSSERRFN